MTLSHLHLVLNHVPVIGSVVAIGLLLLSLVRRSADLRLAGLEVFVLVGLVAMPVYLSGIGAMLPHREELTIAAVQLHHDAALHASLLMLVTGMAAWVCVWQTRRITRPAPALFGAVLLLAVVTLAMMGRAANLGGQIRHPEVLTALQAAQAAESSGWLTAAAIAQVANFEVWAWPAAETLHFIGLWLLFGILLAVNLRLLGVMKAVPFPVLHRFLPWAMLGLTINILTGMMFVIGLPGQYAGWTFYWKIGLLMVGGGNLLYLTIADAPWSVGPGKSVPILASIVAVAGICSWLVVMYFGRMLPFLGNAF